MNQAITGQILYYYLGDDSGLLRSPPNSGGKGRGAEGRKTVCNCSKDDRLDTVEEPPINTISELTKQDDKRNPKQQTLRHLIDTSSRFSCPHLGFMLLVCVASHRSSPLPPACS